MSRATQRVRPRVGPVREWPVREGPVRGGPTSPETSQVACHQRGRPHGVARRGRLSIRSGDRKTPPDEPIRRCAVIARVASSSGATAPLPCALPAEGVPSAPARSAEPRCSCSSCSRETANYASLQDSSARLRFRRATVAQGVGRGSRDHRCDRLTGARHVGVAWPIAGQVPPDPVQPDPVQRGTGDEARRARGRRPIRPASREQHEERSDRQGRS